MKTSDTDEGDEGDEARATAGAKPARALDLDHFISMLAHELRNPLAPIRSGLDLLATGKVSEAVRRDNIAMMQRQLAHLVELMDELLDTARNASPCDPAAAPGDQRVDGAPAPDWRGHRLLIVDDNRDAAESLGLLFELDGMTIRLAHDGPSAVAEAHTFQPQSILMDVGLPGFSGLEAVKRIRLTRSQVKPFIVALTGWGTDADRKASQEAGVDLHLVKPVTYEELTVALTSTTVDTE